MKDELIDRVLSAFPREFCERLQESMIEAFKFAEEIVEEKLPHLPKEIAFGQVRHAACEDRLCKLAKEFGFDVDFLDTDPKGAKYICCRKNNIKLLRCNIQSHCGPPRRTKFRKDMAQDNAWLGPLQYNLLEKVSTPSDHALCIMLVTSAFNANKGNPFAPAYIGIGVPSDDLSNWVIMVSLEELIEKNKEYDGEDIILPQNEALSTRIDEKGNVKDLAQPKLKKEVKKKSQEN